MDDGLGNADHEGEHELRALEQEVVLAEFDQAVQPEGVDVRGRDEVSAHVEARGAPGQGAARPDHESLEPGNDAARPPRTRNRLFSSRVRHRPTGVRSLPQDDLCLITPHPPSFLPASYPTPTSI